MTNSHPPGAFATTRWSTITRIWVTGAPAPGGALTELGQRFRYPVYVYLRRLCRTPAQASAHADAFLETLASAARHDAAAPREAQFRRFLVERLDAWLASRAESDGGVDAIAADAMLEARYRREGRDGDDPARAFERAFALEVLARACANLEAEARETGHADMYAALVPWLGEDPPAGHMDTIAVALRSRPLTVVIALKRLRQRLRELASSELADTVVSASGFASEQRALFAVLQHKP